MQRLTTLLVLVGITFTVQAQTNCGLLHDSNANGFVDIEDFLSILGLFGDQDSDGDGVYDSLDLCFDLESCNYMDPEALLCTYPDAIGVCGGFCLSDSDGDGICDGGCGIEVNYQGYDYTTVLIGEQCWFAENLRSENYRNGDAIPTGLDDGEWASTNGGAVAVYNEGAFNNLENYGRLYNWFAVDDSRGLCPSGWHVPTDGEWMTMELVLGMSEEEANDGGYRGTNQGSQMKADYGWPEGGGGTNSSGFSGLPGGQRYQQGQYYDGYGSSYWWSSSEIGFNYRHLNWINDQVYRNYGDPNKGMSVRCIQDSEE